MVTKTLRVHWTNIGHWAQEEFGNEKDALDYIKSKGFEGAVWEKTGEEYSLLVSWSPIGGYRWHQGWSF